STDQESLGIALVANQVFGGRPQDRAHAIAVYRDNVEAVLNTVPAERLLVHKLGDGWAPLCSHLGVPVPEESYPARNTTQEFRSALGIVQ
ncbi:sulfotransferase, partial [Mesorhizobium sp.]